MLVDADDPAHVAPFAHMIAGIGGVMPQVAEAYRTGDGVPYAAYGAAFRHGQGHINRPAFTHELPTDWLAALPDVVARLECARSPARGRRGLRPGLVDDRDRAGLPGAFVDGIDADPASIADSRRHAGLAGVGGRVRFIEADAADLAAEGPYDLVLILESLHDLARPAEALRAARDGAGRRRHACWSSTSAWPTTFTAPGDEVERMMYGWSVTHCLPTQMVEQPSAALGHRAARRHGARARRRGRLRRRRGAARRERLLPPLPAPRLTPDPAREGSTLMATTTTRPPPAQRSTPSRAGRAPTSC